MDDFLYRARAVAVGTCCAGYVGCAWRTRARKPPVLRLMEGAAESGTKADTSTKSAPAVQRSTLNVSPGTSDSV